MMRKPTMVIFGLIVYMFDILQEPTRKATAASAFYNVLVLASKNAIKVDQSMNYADIKIGI